MNIGILVLLFFVLIAVSAFFSAAEVGLMSSSEVMVHKLAKDGHRRIHLLKVQMKERDKFLHVILLGNNLVNAMASSVATFIAISCLQNRNLSSAAIISISTLAGGTLIFLLGEVFPKTITLLFPEKFAIFAAPVLLVFQKLLSPFVFFARGVLSIIFKIFGKPKGNQLSLSAVQELQMALDLKHEQGKFVKDDKDMIDGLLQIWEVRIKQIMTHRGDVLVVNVKSKPVEVVSRILNSPYSRVPLLDENGTNVLGFLHVKDLFLLYKNMGDKITMNDITRILRKPIIATEHATLYKQLMIFKSEKNHIAVVVDEFGTFVGVVTLEDILEEIVGEISDEHDQDNKDVLLNKDGTILISGDYHLIDFCRRFGVEMNKDIESTTMAGAIIDELNYIPKPGEKINLFGYEMSIKETDNQKIKKILITKMPVKK